MNPNENHVSPLAQQIDRLIETHQPTGIPAADDLAATIPQARQDFQQQLEDHLTAQIQFASQGDEKLTPRTSMISNALRPRTYLPLTLAAAMLAVAIVGSFLLLRGGKMPDSNLAVVFEAADTPTPEPAPVRMINIITAQQNLPRGYRFPATAADLADIVAYTSFPEYSIPINALREDQGGLDQLAGKILRTGAFTNQPILSDTLGSDTVAVLAADRVAVSLPIDLVTGMTDQVLVGTQVEISAAVTFIDTATNEQQCPCTNPSAQIFTQVIARNAIVIRVGDFLATPTPDIFTLAVLPDEAQTLAYLANAKIHMSLKFSAVVSTATALPDQANPSDFQPGSIPPGKRGAEIDRNLIANDLAGFKAGDTVDIAISFLTINKNPEFASDPSVDNTTMPDNAFVATKTVFTNVKILVMGGIRNQADTQVISVALNPEDADLLTWILAAHMPIALSVAHSDANDLTVENLPDGKVSVEIPVTSITSEEGYIQASNFVNILARMNFINYNPNNPSSLEPRKLVSQIIVRDAEMTSSSGTVNDGDVMRVKLIIAQDELPTLAWTLKANIPLALQLRPK